MDFRKRLKVRLITAIVYIVLGVGMIVAGIVMQTGNSALSSCGAALLVMGIARVRQYVRITKSEDTLRRQEIRETDERNLYVMHRAKSIAFNIYLLLDCVAVIVLEILQKDDLSALLAIHVFALVILYWVAYWILQKRM